MVGSSVSGGTPASLVKKLKVRAPDERAERVAVKFQAHLRGRAARHHVEEALEQQGDSMATTMEKLAYRGKAVLQARAPLGNRSPRRRRDELVRPPRGEAPAAAAPKPSLLQVHEERVHRGLGDRRHRRRQDAATRRASGSSV